MIKIIVENGSSKGRRYRKPKKMGKARKSRGKPAAGHSSKAMKSVKALLVNLLAVMIFVSVAVILLARFGG